MITIAPIGSSANRPKRFWYEDALKDSGSVGTVDVFSRHQQYLLMQLLINGKKNWVGNSSLLRESLPGATTLLLTMSSGLKMHMRHDQQTESCSLSAQQNGNLIQIEFNQNYFCFCPEPCSFSTCISWLLFYAAERQTPGSWFEASPANIATRKFYLSHPWQI